eukprot:TRINITY_DN11975_c0_g3_i4.p1 TRINITY_DN11975_c0_g3~~TRINITY_DN11975_c0_g3_i4.p1  ORF type:complete len:941 (+),score=119.91 TRINITY_DN11975_c0_g3_i4:85-2823(+)
MDLNHPIGHIVHATISVTNGAGLTTSMSKEIEIPALSLATCGRITLTQNGSLVSTLSNVENLQAAWSAVDLAGARGVLCLGSTPGLCDIQTLSDVVDSDGQASINRSLPVGVSIYASLKIIHGGIQDCVAASNAMLYDPTPPLPGLVTLGFDDFHSQWWGNREAIGVSWRGFMDAESKVIGYAWCLGTAPLMCDLQARTSVGSSQRTYHRLRTPLQEGTVIYATVWADNGAHVTTSASSPQAIVRVRAPSFEELPALESIVSVAGLTRPGYSPSRTALKLSWKLRDTRGVEARVRLVSSDGSEAPVLQTAGLYDLDGTVLSGLDLHDGNNYTAHVTVCSSGGLCTRAISNTIVIDGSGPAAAIINVDPVFPSNNRMSITWSGCQDPHSSISQVAIAIGTSFGSSDMNAGGHPFIHQDSQNQAVVPLNTSFLPNTLHFITVNCYNPAGVSSTPTHVEGSASIRTLLLNTMSCAAQLCDGTCSCGFRHRCDRPALTCVRSTGSSSKHSLTTVSRSVASDAIEIRLAGHEGRYSRYTLGLKGQAPGAGVFTAGDELWFDFGASASAVLIPPQNLLQNNEYVVYAQIWTNASSYELVESAPITITKARLGLPAVRLIASPFNLTASWELASKDKLDIASLQVGFGSHPGQDDVRGFETVAVNSSSAILDLASFSSDGVVYATLKGVTHNGIEAVSVSNAAPVDRTRPHAGRVLAILDGVETFDRGLARDGQAQLTWTAFQDINVGIEEYLMCLDENCTHNKWTSLGLQTAAAVPVNTGADMHVAAVMARDYAGLYSSPVNVTFVYDQTPAIFARSLAVSASFSPNPLVEVSGGILTVELTWQVIDGESGISKQVILVGTTRGGSQLVAPTSVVDSPAIIEVSVDACPKMVYGSISARNGIGMIRASDGSVEVEPGL